MKKDDIDLRTEQLLATTPHGIWPDGMPSPLWPELVLVGISPGNSPAKSDFVWSPGSNLGPNAHEHFKYPDGAGYWRKVREMAHTYFRRIDPAMTEDDALKRTAHLNAGTGKQGQSNGDTVEAEYVQWIARLLNETFQPRATIFLGYVGYLNPKGKGKIFRPAWDNAQGLAVNWSAPNQCIPMEGSRYKFRQWLCKNPDGHSIEVNIWPNHPSRRKSQRWASALQAFSNIPPLA